MGSDSAFGEPAYTNNALVTPLTAGLDGSITKSPQQIASALRSLPITPNEIVAHLHIPTTYDQKNLASYIDECDRLNIKPGFVENIRYDEETGVFAPAGSSVELSRIPDALRTRVEEAFAEQRRPATIYLSTTMRTEDALAYLIRRMTDGYIARPGFLHYWEPRRFGGTIGLHPDGMSISLQPQCDTSEMARLRDWWNTLR